MRHVPRGRAAERHSPGADGRAIASGIDARIACLPHLLSGKMERGRTTAARFCPAEEKHGRGQQRGGRGGVVVSIVGRKRPGARFLRRRRRRRCRLLLDPCLCVYLGTRHSGTTSAEFTRVAFVRPDVSGLDLPSGLFCCFLGDADKATTPFGKRLCHAFCESCQEVCESTTARGGPGGPVGPLSVLAGVVTSPACISSEMA